MRIPEEAPLFSAAFSLRRRSSSAFSSSSDIVYKSLGAGGGVRTYATDREGGREGYQCFVLTRDSSIAATPNRRSRSSGYCSICGAGALLGSIREPAVYRNCSYPSTAVTNGRSLTLIPA